jgi:hypothetical protein
MSLNEYRDLVTQALVGVQCGGPAVRPFDNFGLDHARIVVEAMVTHANTSIKIYSQKLSAKVYDPAWFSNFLARRPEGGIIFLVERSDVFTNAESVLCGTTNLYQHSRVRVKLVPEGLWGRHLAIVDDKFVRVETSQEDFKASVSFGTAPLTQMAIDTFALLQDKSVDL